MSNGKKTNYTDRYEEEGIMHTDPKLREGQLKRAEKKVKLRKKHKVSNYVPDKYINEENLSNKETREALEKEFVESSTVNVAYSRFGPTMLWGENVKEQEKQSKVYEINTSYSRFGPTMLWGENIQEQSVPQILCRYKSPLSKQRVLRSLGYDVPISYEEKKELEKLSSPKTSSEYIENSEYAQDYLKDFFTLTKQMRPIWKEGKALMPWEAIDLEYAHTYSPLTGFQLFRGNRPTEEEWMAGLKGSVTFPAPKDSKYGFSVHSHTFSSSPSDSDKVGAPLFGASYIVAPAGNVILYNETGEIKRWPWLANPPATDTIEVVAPRKQFQKGGYTGTTGGIVDPYEMVMNPVATQKYFNVLQKMNQKGMGSAGGFPEDGDEDDANNKKKSNSEIWRESSPGWNQDPAGYWYGLDSDRPKTLRVSKNPEEVLKPNPFFDKLSRFMWLGLGEIALHFGTKLTGTQMLYPTLTAPFGNWWESMYDYDLSGKLLRNQSKENLKEKGKRKESDNIYTMKPLGFQRKTWFPIFSEGGYTGSDFGIVHPHEMVMNPTATQKFFPVLEKMNYEGRGQISSAPPSPAVSNTQSLGNIHIYVNATHGINVEVGSPDPRVIVG